VSIEDPTIAINQVYNVKNLLTLITIIVLTFSVIFSKASARHAEESQRTQLFLSLRDRYLKIRLSIPSSVYKKNYVINYSDDSWLHVEQYWYNAFDEWYATSNLNGGKFKDLWFDYFGPAIKFSLKYPAMVKVLDSMLEGRVSFGGQRENFKSALQALYKELDENLRADSAILTNARSR